MPPGPAQPEGDSVGGPSTPSTEVGTSGAAVGNAVAGVGTADVVVDSDVIAGAADAAVGSASAAVGSTSAAVGSTGPTVGSAGASVAGESPGHRWWCETLGSARLLVAPMVDASELAWRLLSRRHGAQLCYTPMLHSSVFVRDPKYRAEALASCEEDRPLIVQFCGNEASTLLEAGLLAQARCDGVDLNLGCPQAIARRGRYGSFLQDDWPLLRTIVSTLHQGLSVPVTCKIRVFEDISRTVEYAKMLEAAGCQMLTVHGRTREQKGPLTGLASWAHIKAVRESVKIPVMANGNIQYLKDIHNCLEETGCNGVMTAEGNLYNPAMFEGINPPAWEMALEYLDLAEKYPCPMSYVRGHLFKLFQHCLCLPENFDLRSQFATGSDLEEFRSTVLELKERYLPYHLGEETWPGNTDSYNLPHPPWLCQPYVRIPPEEHLKKMEEKQNRNADVNQYGEESGHVEAEKENQDGGSHKRPRESSVESTESKTMSRRKMRKLRRLKHNPEKVFGTRQGVEKCVKCPNPAGTKCLNLLCKACCKTLCYVEELDCPGHRILIKTRREIARHYSALDKKEKESADPSQLDHIDSGDLSSNVTDMTHTGSGEISEESCSIPVVENQVPAELSTEAT